jgi:hypothetical protein
MSVEARHGTFVVVLAVGMMVDGEMHIQFTAFDNITYDDHNSMSTDSHH